MKRTVQLIVIVCLLFLTKDVAAQVAIGTTTLEDGAIFQMESDNKGLLIPRVALTSRLDISTIHPSQVEGLWVYNTASAGSGNYRVSPGMYFWDSDEWIRLYNRGYSKQFFQTNIVKSMNQTTTYTLSGLNQNVTVPITGTYQIIVVGSYAAGAKANNSYPGVGTSSIWLEIDSEKAEEMWLTSTSKTIGSSGTFLCLARNGFFIHNVDLEANTTYNFTVKAREWDEDNTKNNYFGPWGYGFWGVDTNNYNGNQGGYTKAQKSSMTITLLRQY